MNTSSTVLITTSHRPSYRTRSFIKELASVMPGSVRTHRGKKTLLHLAFEARKNRARYIIVVCEKKGNPSLLRIYEVPQVVTQPATNIIKHRASIVLSGVRLSRETPDSSRVYNPETVNIDPMNCVNDQCFLLADLLLKMLEPRLSSNPDITIVLEEKDVFRIVFRNRLNKLCGPVLKISGVKIIES